MKVAGVTHEYRRFIEQELDARGWQPPDLVRRSGLRRQLVWGILHDDRDKLGQMPDDSTLEGLAKGFGISVERVRLAAARSLDGYIDDGQPSAFDLSSKSADELFSEIYQVLGELRGRIPPLDGAIVTNKSEHFPRGGRIIGKTASGENTGMRRDQQSG